ncbi:MAG: DUF4369 domain-containing protein [Lacinutrix sp.]|uniref:DUF4369 domain-containing protein n=1 Tax=Lacinutrix sp. TaxID=1937692 RepID=UPI0030B3C88E
MLKNISLIFFIFCILSCKSGENDGFKISGFTDSYISGSIARLFRVEKQKKQVLDSTILEKGVFVFEGKVANPDIYYITIDNVIGALPIIVANENFNLEIVTDSISASKVIGSKENDYINIYKNDSQYLRDEYKELSDKFQDYRLKDDKEGMLAVKFSFDSLVLEKGKYDVSFIKKYPSTTLSALTLERITMAKQITEEETNTLYNTLSKEIQETRAAKYALEFIEEQKRKGN